MFDQYRDRVVIAEIDITEAVVDDVDIALYDTFAQPEADHDDLDVLVTNAHVRRVVVYTWNFHEELVEQRIGKGACGYLSKTLTAKELVDALEAIHVGETVISPAPKQAQPDRVSTGRGDAKASPTGRRGPRAHHPGQEQRRDRRSSTFLSMNSIKTYIRSTYRKIGVASRTQAVLWGVEHGFKPEHHRIDHWRGGP